LVKNSKKLVHNIMVLPQLAKLNNYKCFDIFRKNLPKNIDNGIKEIYFKNRTIYILVSHPTIKMELSYSAEELLQNSFKQDSSCDYISENLLKVIVRI